MIEPRHRSGTIYTWWERKMVRQWLWMKITFSTQYEWHFFRAAKRFLLTSAPRGIPRTQNIRSTLLKTAPKEMFVLILRRSKCKYLFSRYYYTMVKKKNSALWDSSFEHVETSVMKQSNYLVMIFKGYKIWGNRSRSPLKYLPIWLKFLIILIMWSYTIETSFNTIWKLQNMNNLNYTQIN